MRTIHDHSRTPVSRSISGPNCSAQVVAFPCSCPEMAAVTSSACAAGVTSGAQASSSGEVPLASGSFSKRKGRHLVATNLSMPTVFSSPHAPDVPPFYSRSRALSESIRALQPPGLERLATEGLPEIPDSSVRVAFCSTALRRETVGTAITINLSLTWRFRQQLTWFLIDFNEDTRLTDQLVQDVGPAISEGNLKLYRSEELKSWHASIAKNTAHMVVGTGI